MHVCLGNILFKLFYLFSYQEEISTCKYQQCHGNQNPKFVMCFWLLFFFCYIDRTFKSQNQFKTLTFLIERNPTCKFSSCLGNILLKLFY